MNAVLYCNWFSRITGSVIDAFEYFIKILEYNADIQLLFVDLNGIDITPLINAFENRYYLTDINYRRNIQYIKKNELIYINFDKVLVLDYGTIQRTRGLIRAKKIIVISEWLTDNPKYMYNKNLSNVVYYGEMPFVYKDYKYRMKFLFDRFRTLNKTLPGYFINSPKNNDHSFVEKLKLKGKRPIYFKQDDHVKNFFELFDCYIYYHANKYFDPHPRLLLECYFYGKDIQYFNCFNIKDGSYYRYRDLKENKLKDRTLSKYDEIVSQFI